MVKQGIGLYVGPIHISNPTQRRKMKLNNQLCLFLVTITIVIATKVTTALITTTFIPGRTSTSFPSQLMMASKSGDQLFSTAQKLRSRLLKSVRQISLRYKMLEPNDKIMVCVSGGKDSATLLHLLMYLQTKLSSIGTNFQVVAVHLNQMQPGYQ